MAFENVLFNQFRFKNGTFDFVAAIGYAKKKHYSLDEAGSTDTFNSTIADGGPAGNAG